MVLSPVRRPHDYSGATHCGGNVLAFSTARSPEARMKYSTPIRPHGARSPRPRSRVPGYKPATHSSSLCTLTRPPTDLGLTDSTRSLAPRQPFHFSLDPTVGPRNPIRNP